MILSDMGERKAVEIIQRILSEGNIDFGNMSDDCAVIEFGDEYLLITTDTISKTTHIPEMASPWQIGWHAVAVNLSDIAAMGGAPLGMVVALGLPRDYNMKSLEYLVEGMKACTSKFGISIFGGDTKESDIVTLTGCAFGTVAKNQVLLRKGAKSGDILAVTGELGKAGAAYHSLKNRMDEEEGIKDLLEIQPRIKEGVTLAKTNAITSCMDISDGLASSIHQLSSINDVGYEVDLVRVPISEKAKDISEKLDIDLEDIALYFGGEYELLVTIDKDKVRETQKALSDIGSTLAPIGIVKKEKRNILIKDSISTILENRGYEHFR